MKSGRLCIWRFLGPSRAVWGPMQLNPGTGRRSASWQSRCMHWINLSEKARMKFLRFCSPTHPASTEKVSRGSRGQVLRGDIGDVYSQRQSEVGVVGVKSTHADDTKGLSAICVDDLCVKHERRNQLDKSRPPHDPFIFARRFHRAKWQGNSSDRGIDADRLRNAHRKYRRNAQPCRVSGVLGMCTRADTHTPRIHIAYT